MLNLFYLNIRDEVWFNEYVVNKCHQMQETRNKCFMPRGVMRPFFLKINELIPHLKHEFIFFNSTCEV